MLIDKSVSALERYWADLLVVELEVKQMETLIYAIQSRVDIVLRGIFIDAL